MLVQHEDPVLQNALQPKILTSLTALRLVRVERHAKLLSDAHLAEIQPRTVLRVSGLDDFVNFNIRHAATVKWVATRWQERRWDYLYF